MTGAYLNIISGGENKFTQLNCEGGQPAASLGCISVANNYGATFENVHIESVVLGGYNPALITFNQASAHFDGINIVDIGILNGTGANQVNISTGARAAIFEDYSPYPSQITVTDMQLTGVRAGTINCQFILFRSEGYGATQQQSNPAGPSHFTINKGFLNQQSGTTNFNGNFNLDPFTTTAFPLPVKFSSYEYLQAGSLIRGAKLTISATYTHYGMFEEASIIVPQTITAFTITLAHTMGATGNQPPNTGARAHVMRDGTGGAPSGALTVVDSGGATLVSASTTATFWDFRFNGTNWVVLTPITQDTQWY
jgi:hypothetical protein